MANDTGLPCPHWVALETSEWPQAACVTPLGRSIIPGAGGEPLISFEGKYFVGTGRDPSNLQ